MGQVRTRFPPRSSWDHLCHRERSYGGEPRPLKGNCLGVTVMIPATSVHPADRGESGNDLNKVYLKAFLYPTREIPPVKQSAGQGSRLEGVVNMIPGDISSAGRTTSAIQDWCGRSSFSIQQASGLASPLIQSGSTPNIKGSRHTSTAYSVPGSYQGVWRETSSDTPALSPPLSLLHATQGPRRPPLSPCDPLLVSWQASALAWPSQGFSPARATPISSRDSRIDVEYGQT